MRLLLILWISIFTSGFANSQIDTLKQSRFDFARTTLGLGVNYSYSGNVNYLNASSQVESFQLNNQLYPVLYFGGLHFWNSTELYFALPFGQLFPKKPSTDIAIENNLSSVFGIKYYPWKINNQTFRPFIGVAISGLNYEQKSENISLDGDLKTTIVYPLQGGFSWRKNKYLLDFQVIYNYENTFEYYISKNQIATINTPKLYFSTTAKLLLEGTKGSEKYYYSGKEQNDYDLFKTNNQLNSFYLAIGPSTSFFTQKSEYNSEIRPFFHTPVNTNVFLDIGIGYFYERINAFAGVSYRNMKTNSEAYNAEQDLKRESFLFEFNKFLFDYQGFVPYVGIGLGYEQLSFNEKENGSIVIAEEKNILKPVIIFGWDILPTKLEYMTLRTNLRYTPSLNIEVNDFVIPASQLEFNIIQLVFYPQRFRNFKYQNF